MSEPAVAGAQFARASALCDLGRHDEAAAMLTELLASDPHNVACWCTKARAELGRGDRDAALHAAKSAIALAPDHEWPHRLASIALMQSGKLDDAAFHAREAARLEPDEWRTLTNLARVLAHRRSDRGDARDAAERGLELAPTEVEPHLAAAVVASAEGRTNDAEAAVRRALAIDPQSAAAHNLRASLHLRGVSGPARLARSATGFASAIRADPRSGVGRTNLEIVLRSFLARVAYLIFVDAYITAQLAGNGHQAIAGVLAAVALLLPAWFAARFVSGLTVPLRRSLWNLMLRRGQIRAALICEVAAVAFMLAAALVSSRSGGDLALAAIVPAVVARVLLLLERRGHASRSPRMQTPHPVSTGALWVLTGAFACAAVGLAYGAANGLDVAASLGVAGGFGIVAAVLAAVAVRRRTSR